MCGCADRMEKYLLPRLRFVYDPASDSWGNPDFIRPSLRKLQRSRVRRHHAGLALRLISFYVLTRLYAHFSAIRRKVQWQLHGPASR